MLMGLWPHMSSRSMTVLMRLWPHNMSSRSMTVLMGLWPDTVTREYDCANGALA